MQLSWNSEYSTLPADDIATLIYEFVIEFDVLRTIGLNLAPFRRYNPVAMHTVILLGYAERGFISTRQLQHFCRHDCRCRCLFHGEVPSHTTFANFINNHLKDSIEEIFQILNLFIKAKADPDSSALFIDGSKFEADANKFSFVWRKSAEKKLINLHVKARLFGASRSLPRFSSCSIPSVQDIFLVMNALSEEMTRLDLGFVNGRGKRNSCLKQIQKPPLYI